MHLAISRLSRIPPALSRSSAHPRRRHAGAKRLFITSQGEMDTFKGTLFKYGRGSSHTAFMTGQERRHVVLVGGLTDGLIPCGYTKHLSEMLETEGWSLVQPLLSSSYMGYGTSSLDSDAKELALLGAHLKTKLRSEMLVIIGHSTGCQDIVRLAKMIGQGGCPGVTLEGAILQAPVSDNEFSATLPGTAKQLAVAEAMVARGDGEECMPRGHVPGGAPMCARRFVSLNSAGGDDDYFTSTMDEGEMEARLGHMGGFPTLLVMSGADEYVPPGVDVRALGERLARTMGPSARSVVVEGGSHALEGKGEELADHVRSFLRGLSMCQLF